MRRWSRLYLGLIQRRPIHCIRFVPSADSHVRSYATARDDRRLPPYLRGYRVFQRINPPSGKDAANPGNWIKLLEPCLPSHLRERDTSERDRSLVTQPALTLEATDVAEIIIAARRNVNHNGNLDLLYELAVVQERWGAVVWIIKLIAEAFAQPPSATKDRLSKTLPAWKTSKSLDELTSQGRGITIERDICGWTTDQDMVDHRASLHLLTTERPENLGEQERFRHDVWGCVWKALGSMTLTCANQKSIAGGEMKFEVLEIIALLHHHEIMPRSIYEYVHSQDSQALRQPPLLHLLSSRILTSLSDAAWRAREAQVVEEAKTKGKYWFRPELASASYRVRIPGVKPEVWLELILWSCLHGGWVTDGAATLRSLAKNDGVADGQPWKPMNWRDRLRRSLPKDEADDIPDLASLKYIFDTRAASAMGLDANAALGLERTISSEVVSAYVEALVSNIRIGVGDRGISPVTVLSHLIDFRKFLSRSNINLATGSWDAAALRFMDSGGVDLQRSPRIAERLPELCPPAGEEAYHDTTQSLPPYICDGSALPHGILHHCLGVQCRNGNLDGALRVFKALQERTDQDKYRSIVSFFQHQRHENITEHEQHSDFFTPGNSGRAKEGMSLHPSLEHQLPSPILASLIEMLLDADAFNVANWFLYNDDIDGPVVTPDRYRDPTLAPVLTRLAIGTDNKTLIQEVLLTSKNHGVLSEVLNAHFKAGQWESAGRVLRWTGEEELPGFGWQLSNLITLASAMASKGLLTHSRGAVARSIFAHIIASDKSESKTRFDSALLVLFAAHSEWAEFIANLQPRPTWLDNRYLRFQLNTTAFNSILKFVMRMYGLSAGQALIHALWPKNVRSMQYQDGTLLHTEHANIPSMAKEPQGPLRSIQMLRNFIRIPHYPEKRIIMYGGLSPNVATLRMFVDQLCEEVAAASGNDQASLALSTTTGISQALEWLACLYHEYGLRSHDFEADLKQAASTSNVVLRKESISIATKQFGLRNTL